MSLRSFRYVLGGDLVGKFFTAFFLLGLVRLLTPDAFAQLMTLQAVIILAVTLPSGIVNRHYLLTADVEHDARSYRALQVTAAGVLGLLSILFVAPMSAWHSVPATVACCVTGAWFEFGRTSAQKSGNFDRWAKAEVVRAMFLTCPLLLILTPLESELKITVLIVCQAAGYILASGFTGSITGAPPRLHVAFSALKDSRMKFIAVYLALVAFMGQLPIMLTSVLSTQFETATFSAAYRYFGILMSVLAASHVVILAKVSENQQNGVLEIRQLQGLAALLVACGATAGYFLIPIVDSAKYSDSPALFLLLSTAIYPALAAVPLVANQMRNTSGALLVMVQMVSALALFVPLYFNPSNPVFSIAAGISIASSVQFLLLWIFKKPTFVKN